MMFPDMFTAQHILHVDGDGVDDVQEHHHHNLSYMLMEMVVMMFPEHVQGNTTIFHVDGDGGDDVHDMFTTQSMFHDDGDGGDDVP